MDAITGLIQLHPEKADRITRAWRKIIEIFGPLSAFQHPFVVSEPGKRRDLIDMPVTDRRGVIGRTGSDRKRSNRPILIAHLQNSRCDRAFDPSTCQRRISLQPMPFW